MDSNNSIEMIAFHIPQSSNILNTACWHSFLKKKIKVAKQLFCGGLNKARLLSDSEKIQISLHWG